MNSENKMPRSLVQELLRLRKEHFNLRMQKASGQLGQVHLLGERVAISRA